MFKSHRLHSVFALVQAATKEEEEDDKGEEVVLGCTSTKKQPQVAAVLYTSYSVSTRDTAAAFSRSLSADPSLQI